MPIKIYQDDTSDDHEIAWLCDGEWGLSEQVEALISWLKENKDNLPPGSYIADIGFSQRHDACGGGAILTPEAMKWMSEIEMCLFISEYSKSSNSDC